MKKKGIADYLYIYYLFYLSIVKRYWFLTIVILQLIISMKKMKKSLD